MRSVLKSLILLLILTTVLSSFNDLHQIERGTLLLRETPPALDSFLIGNKININYVHRTCNFLTDKEVIHYEGYTVPKRNKALIRHVKQIAQKLEEAYLDNNALNDETTELFYELALLTESLKQKSYFNSKKGLSAADIFRLGIDSHKSKRGLIFENKVNKQEAKNADPENLQSPQKDSPFWHKPVAGISPAKQFSQLAALKKIKVNKNMVVVFDKAGGDGSSPKIAVAGIKREDKWSLKWGDEVHTDIVGSHLFAALGYDVDHPYFFGENQLCLVFDSSSPVKNAEDLCRIIKQQYKTDIRPFISISGIVSVDMAKTNTELKTSVGKPFVQFKKCSMEARPDRVKRIGSMVPNKISNEHRRELRGALLAHVFIGNWDTREENTLLTLVGKGGKEYRLSAVFSDLGASFGVVYGRTDFKAGLANEFPWEAARLKNGNVILNSPLNAILSSYENATYQDLLWMAKQIAQIDSVQLRYMVDQGSWPTPIAELFFHKLASRKTSIMSAFGLADPYPISFDSHLSITEQGREVVKDGQLIVDYEREKNPESFFTKKGRLANFGN